MSFITMSVLLLQNVSFEYSLASDSSAPNRSESTTNVTSTVTNVTLTVTNCIVLQFEDFVPWNNPDNIISFEFEDSVRMLKDLVFLPILFLFGCPTNIINMAVFYKQGLKERINVCLFALSLADGLYLINNAIWYGEQLHVRFTSKETYGPVMRFMTNHNLLGLYGFTWVSQVLTAIIASERCFCILHPLRSQTVLNSSTMTILIILINIVVVGLFCFVATRYRAACAYDPLTQNRIFVAVNGDFFLRHQMLVDYLDVFVFGVSLPGFVLVVVITTTIITIVKLRQAAAWRAGTSSSQGLSAQQIALTKMLVANSIFFIACVVPFLLIRSATLFMPEMNPGRRHHNLYLVMMWILTIISYFNSSFNILVYYSMDSRYRHTFWQLFRRIGKSENENFSPEANTWNFRSSRRYDA